MKRSPRWLAAAFLLGPAAVRGAPVPVPLEAGTIQPVVGIWEFSGSGTGAEAEVRGDRWEQAPEAGAASTLDLMFRGLPESVLDEVKAFYYFPLALVREGTFAGGTLSIGIRPLSGKLDRAGGLAFGMASPESYWVLRLNTLENNVMLFEYVKARRQTRYLHKIPLTTGRWYDLVARVNGRRLEVWLDGRRLFTYDLPRPVVGKFGLWSKADSVTRFRRFAVDAPASVSPPGR